MANISMSDMLAAGVHFGHQTRFWNPKMAPFIFGARNKIHIINLERTVPAFNKALGVLKTLSARRHKILFVGTKRSAAKVIREQASRVEHAVRRSALARRHAHELQDDPPVDASPAGTRGAVGRRHVRAADEERSADEAPPDGEARAQPRRHQEHGRSARCAVRRRRAARAHRGISEANKLGIPVVGIVDTNSDPVGVDYVIPGNDDAIRAMRLYVTAVADAIDEGHAASAGR